MTAVAVAQFMVALDMAVMNVALPSIRTDLGFAPLDLSWVVHIYALTFRCTPHRARTAGLPRCDDGYCGHRPAGHRRRAH
ncbi:hypothetical protein [Nocardia cyriacigeorgica]|uniref:hypothetical protein n=1 Tax=Nocardia cyriacigeorgica TaxID=135487 RepID=UPI002113B5C2|nr:hypothetical protein [Nocardia cyriacigeorgica]